MTFNAKKVEYLHFRKQMLHILVKSCISKCFTAFGHVIFILYLYDKSNVALQKRIHTLASHSHNLII